jgi:hypothetical protein
MLFDPLMRSAKFTTSWSVPVEESRGDWLSEGGWMDHHIVPLKPRTTGYVGKAENDGSKGRTVLSARRRRKK